MRRLHCDQVRSYLSAYRERRLPTYRAAWIAQHLAGCPVCMKALLQVPASAEAHPEGTVTSAPGAAQQDEVIQRPVPRWYKVALLVCVGLLALLLWVFVTLHGPPGRQVARSNEVAVRQLLSEPIRSVSSEVDWVLESLEIIGNRGVLLYRIQGSQGRLRIDGLPTITVVGVEEHPATLHDHWVREVAGGLRGGLVFELPVHTDGVLITFPHLHRFTGDRLTIGLDRHTEWAGAHGIQVRIISLHQTGDGFYVTAEIKGEGDWRVVPELGVSLFSGGRQADLTTWLRERPAGERIDFRFAPSAQHGYGELLVLPLAEKVHDPWTAWIAVP